MDRLSQMEASPEHSAPSTPASRRPSKKASATFGLNVASVVLGDRLIKPWYPSLYREELMGSEPVERLFVCERCFKYTKDPALHVAHMVGTNPWGKLFVLMDIQRFCSNADLPPGRIVYEKDRYSIYEVDGEEHRVHSFPRPQHKISLTAHAHRSSSRRTSPSSRSSSLKPNQFASTSRPFSITSSS